MVLFNDLAQSTDSEEVRDEYREDKSVYGELYRNIYGRLNSYMLANTVEIISPWCNTKITIPQKQIRNLAQEIVDIIKDEYEITEKEG